MVQACWADDATVLVILRGSEDWKSTGQIARVLWTTLAAAGFLIHLGINYQSRWKRLHFYGNRKTHLVQHV